MRVSQKAEYALRAMLELTLRYQAGQPVRTAEIAREQKIPEKFLELILVDLRHGGLITSQRGPVGGHRLSRRPEEISVGDVWRVIDGEPEHKNGSKGKAKDEDPFAEIWTEVDKAVAKVVDHVSLADVRRRAEAGRNVADFSI
ncbi:MAG TPA: Rrf2 family transcriptional regulator [Planctomycetota bacterium]|nr:Rrf2 family transcriptional regulator [Planctomycetota bacterium]